MEYAARGHHNTMVDSTTRWDGLNTAGQKEVKPPAMPVGTVRTGIIPGRRMLLAYSLQWLDLAAIIAIAAYSLVNSRTSARPMLAWGTAATPEGTFVYAAPPAFFIIPVILVIIGLIPTQRIYTYGWRYRQVAARLAEQGISGRTIYRRRSRMTEWIVWSAALFFWAFLLGALGINLLTLLSEDASIGSGFYLSLVLVVAGVALNPLALPSSPGNEVIQIDDEGNAWDADGNPYQETHLDKAA